MPKDALTLCGELREARDKVARLRELNPHTYTTLQSYRIVFNRIDRIEADLAALRHEQQARRV